MKVTIKSITRVGVFGALAGLLYIVLSFPFPFLPLFLKINFSDVVALIGGYIFGPLTGILIQVIKVIIKIIFEGSGTGYIGELSDLVLGMVFVLAATSIYQHKRNFKSAVIGLILGTIIHTIAAAILNYFILIPFYVSFMKAEEILKLCTMIANIKDTGWSLIIYGVIPFNLLRDVIIVILTLVLYKRTHKIIQFLERRVGLDKNTYSTDNCNSDASHPDKKE